MRRRRFAGVTAPKGGDARGFAWAERLGACPRGVVGWRVASGAAWGEPGATTMRRIGAIGLAGAVHALLVFGLGGCDRTAEHPAAGPEASPAPVAVTGALAQVAGTPQAGETPRATERPVLAWRSTNGVAYEGDPLVRSDGGVCVLSPGNGVYAYSSDGRVRWTYGAGMGLACAMALGKDDSLFVLDDLGRVHKLAPDGSVVWIAETDESEDLVHRRKGWGPLVGVHVAPLPDGGAVARRGLGGVHILSGDGAWEREISFSGEISAMAVSPAGDIYVVSGGSWVTGSEPSRAGALSRLTMEGEPLWSRRVSVGSWVTLSSEGLPVVITDGGARELDGDGAVLRDPKSGWARPQAMPEPNRWLASWGGDVNEWNGAEWRTLYSPPEEAFRDGLQPVDEALATPGPDGTVYVVHGLAPPLQDVNRPCGVLLTGATREGATLWRVRLETAPFDSVSAAALSPDGAVYSILGGVLCKFDDASRVSEPVDTAAWRQPSLQDLGLERAWSVPTPGPPTDREYIHIVESGRVYALLEQPEAPPQDAVVLMAVEPDGAVRWRDAWGDFVLAHPAIAEADDGSIWLRADGRLYWIPSTGGDRWRVEGRFSDISPPIPVEGGRAIAVLESDGPAAVSRRGETLWRHGPFGSGASITFDGSVAYVFGRLASGEARLAGLSVDGRELWSVESECQRGHVVDLPGGGAAVVGEEHAYGVDPDGQVSWRVAGLRWDPSLWAQAHWIGPEARGLHARLGSAEVILGSQGRVLQRWWPDRAVERLPPPRSGAAGITHTRRYPNGVVAWHAFREIDRPGRVLDGPNGWLYVREGTELTAYRPVAPPALPGEGEHR